MKKPSLGWVNQWYARRDSNPRHPDPKSGALVRRAARTLIVPWLHDARLSSRGPLTSISGCDGNAIDGVSVRLSPGSGNHHRRKRVRREHISDALLTGLLTRHSGGASLNGHDIMSCLSRKSIPCESREYR